MKLFWFSDANGHHWSVIVASNEESAWKLLMANIIGDNNPDSHITIEEVQEQFELDTTSDLTEGVVATIFPLECDFVLRSSPTQE